MDEGPEHDVEFVKAGEDSPKAFQSPKQPLDFIATPVHGPVIFPWRDAIPLWRHDRRKSQIKYQLACFISLVCLVHDHAHA